MDEPQVNHMSRSESRHVAVFRLFLDKHTYFQIQTNIFDDRKALIKFHNLLTDIYTDTPLILKTISKKKITFHKGERFGENSGFFSTTYEEL